mmetsp:Transcript_39968/g.98026  ORF Transcript_39968/g.98026 Transcript_39968/m.98026 type:complete len:160 (+) Transcript_39968:65-544(+)
MAEDYKTKDYYFAEATRDKAEQVLRDAPHGSFILRPSSKPGAVAITIKEKGGGVQHALIERIDDGQFQVQLSADVRKRSHSIVALLDSLIPHYLKPNPLKVTEARERLTGSSRASSERSVRLPQTPAPPPPPRTTSLNVLRTVVLQPGATRPLPPNALR